MLKNIADLITTVAPLYGGAEIPKPFQLLRAVARVRAGRDPWRRLAYLGIWVMDRSDSRDTRIWLSAIRTFARYVATRCPEQVECCSQIAAIPRKKAAPPVVGYLKRHEIDALLAVPDTATHQGR